MPNSESAASQCRAFIGFWTVLLAIIVPTAVLFQGPQKHEQQHERRLRRRLPQPQAHWHGGLWQRQQQQQVAAVPPAWRSVSGRLQEVLEKAVDLLHLPPGEEFGREPTGSCPLHVVLFFLLRWHLLLSLLWLGMLVAYGEEKTPLAS